MLSSQSGSACWVFVAGLVRRERKPIQVRPQAMLEARDLPRCDISDFLQSRIDDALSREQIQRAKQEGVSPEQVRPLYPPPHTPGNPSDFQTCGSVHSFSNAPVIKKAMLCASG